MFGSHALTRGFGCRLGAAGLLLSLHRRTLLDGQTFGSTVCGGLLCGEIFKTLFFKVFLQSFAFNRLRQRRTFRRFPQLRCMRSSGFCSDPLPRLLGQSPFGGLTLHRGKACGFFRGRTIPRSPGCRLLCGRPLLRNTGCMRLSQAAFFRDSLQRLFGLGSGGGHAQRFTFRFGQRIGFSLRPLPGGNARLQCSSGSLFGCVALTNFYGQIPVFGLAPERRNTFSLFCGRTLTQHSGGILFFRTPQVHGRRGLGFSLRTGFRRDA